MKSEKEIKEKIEVLNEEDYTEQFGKVIYLAGGIDMLEWVLDE